MAANVYEAWLGRAREHHVAGRVIDALLCYRRALREDAHALDARFHIGEIAWHTGNAADAIAHWRSIANDVPEHAASWHALADAYAARGDFTASREAVSRVLDLRASEPRAEALSVLLDVVAGSGNPTEASIAGALGMAAWPLALLAGVAESAARRPLPDDALAALLSAASTLPVVPGEEDCLRRIAIASRARGHDEAVAALAQRYVEACRSMHRAERPLPWPLRCAGARLRIGLVVRNADDAEAFRRALALTGLDVECIALIEGAEAQPDHASFRIVPIPLHAPAAAARVVATFDLDVLIDAAGLDLPVGPLLAQRPSRRLWAIVQGPAEESWRALVDRTFVAADEASCLDALRALREEVASEPAAALAPAELDERLHAAVLAHQRGDVRTARDGYEQLLDVEPSHAPLLYLAGAAARDDGDAVAALSRFRAALDAAPGYVDARVALATSLVDAGDASTAVALVHEGLELSPGSAALARALGQAELACGHASDAIAAFDSALARDPANGDAHYNLGVALQSARRLSEAARAYQRALAFRPDLEAAHFNLGVVFEQQGHVDPAIAAFSNVLRRAPDHVPSYKALADALLAAGRIDEWFANFERFEAHAPGNVALAVNALEVSAYRGDFERVERYLDGLRKGRFTCDRAEDMLDALSQLMHVLQYFDVEPELFGRYARTHDAVAQRLHGEPLPRRERQPGKLRIGYLGGDFRNHVMGKMIFEVLRHHDRERFEIIGYAGNDTRDAWTARFESVFSRMIPLASLSDADAAVRVAEDDLDVLVDLSTHTKGGRPGILARKPARVAITHVASAGTLGLSAVDFKLTDRYADVAHDPLMQIEPFLVMEGCVYPYRHIEASPASAFTREALGIPRDAVVIGAFSTPLKLSQRCLAVWRDVFARIPKAVIAFSPMHPALRSVYTRLAAYAGIDARRIAFVPQGRDDAENQARYRVIDFVLDPMPYGGVNGTLEALDMQVPVVTLVGRRHAERSSFSILSNIGATETIAHTGAEYVGIATRLAADVAFRQRVRERIAEGLRRSPLTDMPTHVRHLEEAYIHALASRAPEALSPHPG